MVPPTEEATLLDLPPWLTRMSQPARTAPRQDQVLHGGAVAGEPRRAVPGLPPLREVGRGARRAAAVPPVAGPPPCALRPLRPSASCAWSPCASSAWSRFARSPWTPQPCLGAVCSPPPRG